MKEILTICRTHDEACLGNSKKFRKSHYYTNCVIETHVRGKTTSKTIFDILVQEHINKRKDYTKQVQELSIKRIIQLMD